MQSDRHSHMGWARGKCQIVEAMILFSLCDLGQVNKSQSFGSLENKNNNTSPAYLPWKSGLPRISQAFTEEVTLEIKVRLLQIQG